MKRIKTIAKLFSLIQILAMIKAKKIISAKEIEISFVYKKAVENCL